MTRCYRAHDEERGLGNDKHAVLIAHTRGYITLQLKLCEPGDLPALMALGRAYYAEAGDGVLPVDETKAAWWITRAIDRAFAVAVEEKGEIKGALILDDTPPWWSSAPALFEAGFYIDPQFRKGSRAASDLLDAGKAIAADLGAPFFVTPMTSADLARKDRFFQSRGFIRIGGFYRWSAT